MFRTAEHWKDRADEIRAIAECMKDEETKRMMAEIAHKYDRLAKDADRLKTEKERDEEVAKRHRRQQATASLIATPFSHARAQQAIEALMDAPFSQTRAR
jgi:hypothetical protein